MSNPFRFDGTISLGNLMVVLALVVSIIAAWMANRERSISNAGAVNRIAAEINELEVRVRELERSQR
jgi:hypothetical protein